MLATFRVALHYVRPDNYHVFMSCDVVIELGIFKGWNLTRDLSRFVEIVLFCFVKSLQSWNRNNNKVKYPPILNSYFIYNINKDMQANYVDKNVELKLYLSIFFWKNSKKLLSIDCKVI